MNLDERLCQVFDRCAPSQALSFFYDGKRHPAFLSSFEPIDVLRDDAPAMLSRMIDRFISACDAQSLAQNHNRKVQP